MLIIFAVAVAMQPGAGAGTQPPVARVETAERIDKGRLAAARGLIALFNTEANIARHSAVQAEMTAAAAIVAAENASGETMAEVDAERVHRAARDDIDAMMRIVMPAIERQITQAYARSFTIEELQRLAAMMRDPLIKRMEELSPAILREAMLSSVAAAMEEGSPTRRVDEAIRSWRESRANRERNSS